MKLMLHKLYIVIALDILNFFILLCSFSLWEQICLSCDCFNSCSFDSQDKLLLVINILLLLFPLVQLSVLCWRERNFSADSMDSFFTGYGWLFWCKKSDLWTLRGPVHSIDFWFKVQRYLQTSKLKGMCELHTWGAEGGGVLRVEMFSSLLGLFGPI